MMEKLGGAAFVPNPLKSPALMVLASTADATRSSDSSPGSINDYHPVYSSPNSAYLDSNAVHRMVLSSSPYQHRASHLSLYHSQGGDPYLERVSPDYSPHFFQLHPHLSPGLLHKASGPTAVFNSASAFRRINPHEHSFSFHHLQQQRGLLERERGFESIYHHKGVNLELERERMSSKERVSPKKLDREPVYQNGEHSASPSPRSTHSNDNSDIGGTFEGAVKVKTEQNESTECCNRQREETLKERPKRKLSAGHTPSCPICGLTIRAGEMQSHLAWEIERLGEDTRKTRRSQREAAAQARKMVHSQTVNKRIKQEGQQPNIPNDDTPASTRHQTYLRVCANRMARQGRSSAKSTRSRSAQSSPINPVVYHDNHDVGTSGVKSATCPVCESVIHGSGEELNAHVESCLRKRGEASDEVNGQTSSFEEYEWAGQTRIRATSLLEGGFKASGFQTGIKRKINEEDDADLNIDGDDSEEFGKPQYSESDVIPCSADEPGEDRARQALRGAVLSCENSPASRNTDTPPRTRWSEDERENGHAEEKTTEEKDKSDKDASDPGVVINSLKSKVKDLEKQSVTEKVKCLICMEPYTVPLVSISCWHVHCEECWLRTLGAKKLCPQCNMITSPNDLRKIYL
ncbi:E3 ubiquitin-protein ligase RNF220 isoform X2 [Nematostella vectensis]|uniref:E3 ubiquitin-protein ligase RNF220 isoform X2 n=1 Tax=Nematostella vectensis TaxID=45351 RepID=UPI0020773DDE|nr:E3 ubiquitin-protein ligase RNF220 isoform X2 [Nematostella vectensis]